MLDANPETRWSGEQVLTAFSWVSGITATAEEVKHLMALRQEGIEEEAKRERLIKEMARKQKKEACEGPAQPISKKAYVR